MTPRLCSALRPATRCPVALLSPARARGPPASHTAPLPSRSFAESPGRSRCAIRLSRAWIAAAITATPVWCTPPQDPRFPLIGTAATSPAPYPPPQPPLNPRAPPPHRSALLRRAEHLRRREATATLHPNPCNPPPQLCLGPRINTEAAIPNPRPRLPRIFSPERRHEHSDVDPRDQDDRSCTHVTRPRAPHPPRRRSSPPTLLHRSFLRFRARR